MLLSVFVLIVGLVCALFLELATLEERLEAGVCGQEPKQRGVGGSVGVVAVAVRRSGGGGV